MSTPALLGVANTSWVGYALVLVLATLALLMQFQLTGLVEAGWLTALLLIASVHAVSRPSTYLTDSSRPPRLSLADVLLPLALLTLWALSRQVSATGWRHPLLIGVLGGLVMVFARPVDLGVAKDHAVLEPVMTAYALVALSAATVWTLRMRTFPLPTRIVMLTCVLVSAAALQFPYWALDRAAALTLAAVLCLLGIVLVVSAVLTVLYWGIARHQRTVAGLVDRTRNAEYTLVSTSGLLEDLRTSLIGLHNASQLLADAALTQERQQRLRQAVDAELSRLERLLQRPLDESLSGPFDVDRAILEGARSWRAGGRFIEIRPTGLTASGSAVHVASTMHTLLGTIFAGDDDAQVTIWPTYAGTQVLINVEVYGRHAHFLTIGVSEETDWATIQASRVHPDGPLSVMRNGLRSRGGDLHWSPTPHGADFTLALRR